MLTASLALTSCSLQLRMQNYLAVNGIVDQKKIQKFGMAVCCHDVSYRDWLADPIFGAD